MAAVTISPSEEALSALVDRINSGTAYALDVIATASDLIIDPLEEITGLRVDVVEESVEQLIDTLAVENRTSHVVRIWIRQKVLIADTEEISRLKLIVSQIFQRVNNFYSASNRVKVWECAYDPGQVPDKSYLNQMGLFLTSIVMRVEVEPS